MIITIFTWSVSVLLAAGDALQVNGNLSRAPWTALVSGPVAGGGCREELLRGVGNSRVPLQNNFVPGPASALDPTCRTRVVVFGRGSGPGVAANPFTAGVDVIQVPLTRLESIELQQWLLTCRNELGEPCKANEPNMIADDAIMDWNFVRWAYNESMAGVDFLAGPPRDVQDQPGAIEFEKKLAAAKGAITCPEAAGLLKRNNFMLPAKLNVYYTSIEIPTFCEPGFILIPPGTSADVLAHEIAHALLGDPDHKTGDFLSPGASDNRCSFNIGQSYEIHRRNSFRKFRRATQSKPLPFPDLELCKGMECRGLLPRHFMGPCPQELEQETADWIRCIHCPVDRPPRHEELENLDCVIGAARLMLGGYLRLEDRLKITRSARELATELSRSVRGAGEKQLFAAYHRYVAGQYSSRAAEALGQFTQSCQLRRAAIAALDWALPEGKRNPGELPPKPVPTNVAENARFWLKQLNRNSPCPAN